MWHLAVVLCESRNSDLNLKLFECSIAVLHAKLTSLSRLPNNKGISMFRHVHPAIYGGNIANIYDHIKLIRETTPTVAEATVEYIAFGNQRGDVNQVVTRERKGQSFA